MTGRCVVALLLWAATGCGSVTPRETSEPRAKATAQRIYWEAEAHFARGQFVESQRLWRLALEQLPDTPRHDLARHKLLLRMGYGAAVGAEKTHDVALLKPVMERLELYVVGHRALSSGAEGERLVQEVYAILGEMEVVRSGLVSGEPMVEEPPGARTPMASTSSAGVASADTVGDQEPATNRGSQVDAGMFREVTVPANQSAVTRAEQWAMRAAMRSPFWDSSRPMVLTRPPWALLHEARPMLRQRAPARAVATPTTCGERQHARALGRRIFLQARPALRECYMDAFTRTPAMVSDAVVRVAVDADGAVVGTRLVQGGVVDGLGDACVIESLRDVRLASAQAIAATEVELDLRFFFQDAVRRHSLCLANGSQPFCKRL